MPWPWVDRSEAGGVGRPTPLRPRSLAARLVLFLLALLDLALELLHDVRVAERRDVAELLALADVAQQPAHDLARPRLRQVVGPDDALGPRELADALRDVLADLVDEVVRALEVALERHERRHGLAGVLVALADARGLGDLRVRDDRALDLRGRHAVAGHVDDVVDAPDDPEVVVLVLARGVADEVRLLAELLEVRLDVAVVVAEQRAQHAGPRLLEDEQALLVALGLLTARLVEDPRLDARQRRAGRPGLHVLRARQRRDHDLAGLGLPPGVDDRAVAAADDLPVPQPRLRVDRLADRPEEPDARQVVLVGVLVAPLHAGADGRRRRVEDRHLVALAEFPPDVLGGVVRRALVHHRRRAVGERAVDDVAVPGDPADVGRAPPDVLVRLEVEDVPVRPRHAGEVAAGRVLDALRLRRRARRVQDVQRVLGVEL